MRRSPLHDFHSERGARFVAFGDWEMPVRYTGVLAEHGTVRTGCGLFDVSHLGRFSVSGPGATALLRRRLCNDAAAVASGRAQYTMALNDRGGVVDDIIIWRWDEESYWVLPNGANHDAVVAAFAAEAPPGVTVEGRRDITALLAVQGPNARAVAGDVIGDVPGRFRVAEGSFAGHPVWMAGTGYTGERGFEAAVPIAVAGELATALVSAGAEPCGLGARDTLRLEMGYPLWGQDLDEDTTPLEAGLGWVVDWDHDFVGRAALERQRDGGLPKRLVGFVMTDRPIPRHGYPLRGGGSVGEVASGNYSPGRERGIGMGYLSPDPGAIETVEVEVRGTWQGARVEQPPFITGG